MTEQQVTSTEDREVVRKARLQNRLGPEVQEFRDSRLTLQLATVDSQGIPHASYTPFAFDKQGYYILVSDLADHGKNLKVNKNVSIMMVQDESEAKNVHARKRLTFNTIAVHFDKQSPEGQAGVTALIARFGEMAENLCKLNDFNLYKLMPNSGRFVKGFGQAFNVSGNDLVDFLHLDEGHVSEDKKQLEK